MFVILLLLVATGVLAVDYRLPVTVTPSHYSIKLIPYFEDRNFTFDGEVDITVTAVTETDTITLHHVDLEILETPIVTSVDGFQILQVLETTYDNVTSFYTLKLNESLLSEREYRIHISYIGNLQKEVNGFYRCAYYDANKEKRHFAVSFFEPAFARIAFPCFDEPALKARFRIKIARPFNYTAISNMPRENVSDVDPMIGDRVWDTFQESPPMSTYLVGFMVSDLKSVSTADGRFNMWAQEGVIHRVNRVLSMMPSIMEFMENYTGIDYALPKLDSVAEPCFQGGMENWGMVVYQEWEVLESDYMTAFKEHNLQEIVVHELAHMWFGNLITPNWWDNLWLKEGFARYFEYVITKELKPDWRKEEQFVINLFQNVMHNDVYDTHPIITRIANPTVPTMHVSIVYGKAACIIRMMSHFLTQETFKKGLRRYFKTYAYSVANSNDMFQAMEDEQRANHILPGDIDVKSVMDSWTLQMSFPIIIMRRSPDGGVHLTQRKLLTGGNSLWWIPLSYTTSTNIDFIDTRAKAWMKGKPNITLGEYLDSSEWIIFNIQSTGYFRVNYDPYTWSLIINYLRSPHFRNVHALNRAQLLDDAFFLANVSLLNITIALDLSLYLTEETDYVPWASFLTILSHVNEYIGIDDVYDSFRNYALFLMRKMYESVGFEDREDDTHLIKVARFNILYWACYLGQPDCVRWASTHYTAWLTNPTNSSLSLDLRGVVLCTALRFDRDIEWEQMWDVFVAHNVSMEFLYLLVSLQCSEHYKDVLDRYSNLTTNVQDLELEDLYASGMTIRTGTRNIYLQTFNRKLNYKVSVFNDLGGRLPLTSTNSSTQGADENETTRNTSEEGNVVYRDFKNWLRNFERQNNFL